MRRGGRADSQGSEPSAARCGGGNDRMQAEPATRRRRCLTARLECARGAGQYRFTAERRRPGGRQPAAECRAAGSIVLRANRAAMRGDDRPADRQPQTQSLGAERHERLEHALELLGGMPTRDPDTIDRVPSRAVESEICRSSTAVPFMASHAFSTRLRITCCSWTRSPSTSGIAGSGALAR